MTLKERWNKADDSETTPVGRLVLLITSILIFFRLPSWINLYEIIKTDGGIEIVGDFILFWVVLIIVLAVLALATSLIFVVIKWILTGDYDYEEGLGIFESFGFILERLFKMFFGDYENKYDFSRKEK